MTARPALVVDVRKAHDAGIGTYIRHVVPSVLSRLSNDLSATVLVPATCSPSWDDWLGGSGVRVAAVRAAPLGFAEQVELRACIGAEAVFWATSLSHPIGRRGRLVATVHDVAQLALDRDAGVPRIIAWAAGRLLDSQRRRADMLLAVSDFTRREFLHHAGTPQRGTFTVTPLGVDASWFEAGAAHRESAPRPPYFICVGSVRPHKNIARLLQAFAGVADRLPHELRVAGPAQRDGQHEQWWAALPDSVRQRVRFTGFVDAAALHELVAGADALVFPSLYEGFGLPALEAMAAGCPVLASNSAALPEVCGDAAAAYFDPRSIEQIKGALLEHANLAPAARRAVVERGIAHARRSSWETTADLTAAAIDGVLQRSTA